MKTKSKITMKIAAIVPARGLRLGRLRAYGECVKPVFNIEENIGKVVGRRRAPADSLEYALGLQRTLNRMAPLRLPRGVFRFSSHEEADRWLMDHMTRKRAS